jgi:hypothetical protein
MAGSKTIVSRNASARSVELSSGSPTVGSGSAEHLPPWYVGRILAQPQRRIGGENSAQGFFYRDLGQGRAKAVMGPRAEVQQPPLIRSGEAVGIEAMRFEPRGLVTTRSGDAQKHHRAGRDAGAVQVNGFRGGASLSQSS